jgi:lysophospholipase
VDATKPEESGMRAEAGPALYATAGNAPPPAATASSLRASDGARLRAAHWPAPAGARGTVILLQGRIETIEKYFETIADLQQRGFAVATLDWRGQGGSARLLADPHKGHVRAFEDYLCDLDALMHDVAERSCPRPFGLLAHSLGGLIGLHALSAWPERFRYLVTTTPLLEIAIPHPALARVVARFGPRTRFVPGGARFNPITETFEVNPVTRDRARFARNVGIFREHPALAVGGPTLGWLKAAYQAMDRIFVPGFAARIKTPVFIATAEDDLIVDNRAQARLAALLPRCRHVIIPDARHEILMERDAIRWAFWRHCDEFLASVLGAPA